MATTDLVLLHNDAHHFNIVWDSAARKVTGVLDFGDARIGDIHREFAPLTQLEPALGEAVATQYAVLSGRRIDLERVVAHTVMRTVFDMVSDVRSGSGAKLDTTRTILRDLAGRHPEVLRDALT
jgi:aminoglycoside phosphotransferase (APT) family kinase protein